MIAEVEMVIKSKTTPVVFFSFLILLMTVTAFILKFEGDIIVTSLIGLILALIITRYWIATGKILIMNENGCKVRFLFFEKSYTWNEFNVKRLENNQFYISYKNQYTECVIFSQRNIHKPKWMSPVDYSFLVRPFSIVFVNFKKANLSAIEKTLPAIYEVDRDEFMGLMKKWNVMIS